ncbi:hypothetical protein GCM10009801_27410 [Streptomyces albiaxialis]|uniref:Uncharacterized protein n=1 Tax=Streptomyces albiaxialis TaxID=329523 RepID=A0ABP5HEV1_9ACTN
MKGPSLGSSDGGAAGVEWRLSLPPVYGAALAKVTKQDDGTATGRYVAGADFMLMRSHRTDSAGISADAQGWKSPTDLDTRLVADLGFLIYAYAVLPGVRLTGKQAESGYQAWAVDDASSGAVAVGAGTVTEYGPRALWEELEKAAASWRQQGSPGLARYGLTVTRDAQYTWLDEPGTYSGSSGCVPVLLARAPDVGPHATRSRARPSSRHQEPAAFGAVPEVEVSLPDT